MASEQKIQLAQGALFLIDNAGTCPNDKKELRQFTEAAIARHLTQHTYYYQDHGRSGERYKKRVDTGKFRSSFKDLFSTRTKHTFRRSNPEDTADALFKQKSKAIMENALKEYRYDFGTFSESDLPAFVGDNADNLKSREKTRASSTPVTQAHAPMPAPKRKLVSSDEPHEHPTKRPRTGDPITEADGNDPSAHMPRASQEPSSAPLLRAKRGLEPSDESQQHAAKRPRTKAPIALPDHEEASTKLPRCRRCIQGKKGVCDRQRPCGSCKAAGYDLSGCIVEEQNHDGNVRHPDTDTTNNITGPRSSREVQPHTMDTIINRPQNETHNRSEESGDQTGSTHTTANFGKRKRETNETGTEAGLDETQAAHVPGRSGLSKRQATGSLIQVNADDGQARAAAPVLENTTPNVPNGTNNNTAVVADKTITSDQTDTTMNRKSDRIDKLPENLKNVEILVKQLKGIKRGVEDAAYGLLECMGHIKNILCPLDLNPSEQLEALYVRCWGAEWETTCTNYLRRGEFRMIGTTMSLIGAYLHEKILKRQAYDKEIAQDLITRLQANGSTGKAFLEALDFSKRGEYALDLFLEQKIDAFQNLKFPTPPLPSRSKKPAQCWPKMTPPFSLNCKWKQRLSPKNSGISCCRNFAVIELSRSVTAYHQVLRRTTGSRCSSEPSPNLSKRHCAISYSSLRLGTDIPTSGHAVERSSSTVIWSSLAPGQTILWLSRRLSQVSCSSYRHQTSPMSIR